MNKAAFGFTLIELIVVVAIIAILASVAVPTFLGLQTRAEKGVVVAYASNLATAVNLHNANEENTKITSTHDWLTQTDVDTELSDLTVVFSNAEYIPDAAKLVAIDPVNFVATVDSTIS